MQIERIGAATLYCGDCLEVLPTLGMVDAVIMDPPYELGAAPPGASASMSLGKFAGAEYAALTSGYDYGAIFGALDRICDPFNLFCFCSNRQISKIMAINELADRITTLLIWHKTNAAPFANGVWRGDIEYVVHARGAGAAFNGGAVQKKKVYEHPIVKDDRHPTVKPIALIEKYISISTNGGDAVLDPFMGSGTTGVACANLGRDFIGIEIDQRYFDIACERISAAYSQGRLFV